MAEYATAVDTASLGLGSVRVPTQPPRPQVRPRGPDIIGAILHSVDDTTNPTIGNVLIKDQFPASSGYVLPANMGLQLQEAPEPFVAPPDGTAYWNNKTSLQGGSFVTVNTKTRQILSIQGRNTSTTTKPVKDLEDLGDVDITSPSSGQFLKWNGTDWVNSDLPPTSLALQDLTDVSVTDGSVTDGWVLGWNGSDWVAVSMGLVPTGASLPGSALEGALFYLTTTPALNIWHSGAWVAVGGGGGATTLATLTDVNVTEGAGIDGFLLYWNNSASKWEAKAIPAGSLATLTDVSVTEGAGIDGFALYWNNGASKWEAKAFPAGTLAALGDVSVTEGAGIDGYVLYWNNGASKWEAKAIPAGSLSGLTDVTLTSPANGDLLTYDSTASKWENKPPSAAGISSGTSFPGSPTTGQQFFRTDLGAMFWYSGSAWLNVDSLKQLEDVSLSSPSTNQVLAFNGSAWVNKTIGPLISNYDSVILAESSLTHYWPMNEAVGATAAVDAKGSSNMTAHGAAAFGSRPMTRDGESSVLFQGVSTSDYLDFPSGVLTSSGLFSLEMIISGIWIFNTVQVFFSLSSGNQLDIYAENASSDRVFLNIGGTGGVVANNSQLSSGTPTHLTFVWTGASAPTLYINAVPRLTGSGVSRPVQASAGTVGMKQGASFPFGGCVSKIAVYNDALTAAKVAAHYAAM